MSVINHTTSRLPSKRRTKPRGHIGTVACGMLVSLLGCWLGIQAARPFLLAGELRAQNDAIERQMLRYRLQNQRAEIEIKALDTDAGLVRAARKLGWVMPGERKLRIPNP